MQGDTRRGRATNPAGAAGSFLCHRKAILVRGMPTADRDRPCSMPNDRLPFIGRTVPLPRHFAAGLSGFATGQDSIASTICLIASSLARKRLRRASCVRIETAPARERRGTGVAGDLAAQTGAQEPDRQRHRGSDRRAGN